MGLTILGGGGSSAVADLTLGFPGILAPPPAVLPPSYGLTTLTANRAQFSRFVAPKNMTLTGITFEVTTADAGNPNVDVGVFTTAGTMLASSGATAGKLNAIGDPIVSFTAPLAVTKGTHFWAALSSPSATAVIRAYSYQSNNLNVIYGAGFAVAGLQNSLHPLANATISTATNAALALVVLGS